MTVQPPQPAPSSRPGRDPPEVLSRFHGEFDLVDINARQVVRRIGPSVTLDDLRSFGQEGLLHAARSFEPSHGVPFRRWANLRIRGAMIDGVRRWGSLPRRVYRELRSIAAADQVAGAYDEEHAASPAATPEAADARLTTVLAGMATAMTLGRCVDSASEEIADPEGERDSPEALAMRGELVARIKRIVSGLPDAERTLVERHYFAEENLDQAAASIGLSKSWGSRLHARAIEAIGRELRKSGIEGP